MTKKKNIGIRWIVPAVLALVWIGIAGIGGPYFGRIDEVSSTDLTTFLPQSSESAKVNDELKRFRDASTIPVLAVFESKTDITDAQQTIIKNAMKKVDTIDGVDDAVNAPVVVSDDKKAAFVAISLPSDGDFAETLPRIKETIDEVKTGIDYKLTGPATLARDLQSAFAGIDGTLLFVALGVVFFILLVVYRSPILPIITLTGALAALSAAIFIVWHMAEAGVVQLNGQVQGILFILVIGAATDYSLLYIARYREELTRNASALQATKAAWKASFEPIVAAGSTVAVGLMCLLVSDLGSNKALGPVGSIGIGLAVLVAITFLPAVLLLFGRAAFWPRMPHRVSSLGKQSYRTQHPTWTKVGALVRRHPRRLWIGSTVVLALFCLAAPQLKADGVSQENLILGYSESREGQKVLDKHFPAGSGAPAVIVADQSKQDDIVALLDKDSGVSGVSVFTTDEKKSSMPLGKSAVELRQKISDEVRIERDKQLAEVRSAIEDQMAGLPSQMVDAAYESAVAKVPSVESIVDKAYPFADTKEKVIDSKVLLQATLNDSASSLEARQVIDRLRGEIRQLDSTAMVGGSSAIQLDTNVASERDLVVIIPLILAAITIILMLLLRSLVAPLVLLGTTVLSFGATIGIAALLFNHVWHFPGADPSVVIFGFVFLVALGIDYNIFLMTRVREETKKHGVHTGTIKALVVTGGVITSAGIVLAATFAALSVIPILFLVQIAFVVAFGVLLDTLLVRSLLVPSLTVTIGKPMWWPTKNIKE